MKKIAHKFVYMSLMLFLISAVSFLVVALAPNSFLSAGELNPNMTKESIETLRAIYGLDKPLYEQYLNWIFSIFKLDFGVSFVSGQSVSDEIFKRLEVTIFINLISLVAIFVFSLYLGVKAALNHEKSLDRIISQFSLVSFAMPSFYLSLVFIIFFSMTLELFPISGLHSTEPKDGFLYYLDMLWHLALPISVMIFVGVGNMIVYIRSLTIEILKSDYYYFALSRGFDEKRLLRFYIIPNLLPPIITLLGLSLPALIGGSVILESIFSIEGMGQLFFMSAMSRDYPVIMGILIITAFLTLLGNILADLILLKLNPYTK